MNKLPSGQLMSNRHQIDIKHKHQRIGQKCKSNQCQNLALN